MQKNASRAQYGSDVMAEILRMLDIEYVSFNPGSTFRGLHDSIVNYLGNNKPETIMCNHEGIAIAFAQGYEKVAGKPMAVIVHDVVGLLHCAMHIYGAWLDKSSILILGGTGPVDTEKRRPGIDWTHTALVEGNVVRDYVKFDDQPSSLAGVPNALLRAYQIAIAEPKGPVYVGLDVGLQEELLTAKVSLPSMKRYPNPSSPQADADTIERMAKLLVKASNPVVIASRMGRNPAAVPSLIALAELLALPVIDSGKFNIPDTHPLNLSGAAGELLKEADVILALDVPNLQGSITATETQDRQSTRSIIPEKCQIIHISLDHLPTKSWSQSYGRLMPVDIPVTADTALVLPPLTAACKELLTEKRRVELKKRFDNLKAMHKALRGKWQTMAENEKNKSPLTFPWIAKQVWEVIKDEDWALVNGNFGGWARRLWDGEESYRYAGSGGLGSGMGHALGAALAHRREGRLCINFQTDGDLLYAPSALWTAAHHQIPLLVIMNNNHSYYNSEAHQGAIATNRGRPAKNQGIGTRIENPNVDFAGLARSFGLYGVGPIEKPGDLLPAIEEAVKVVKKKKQLALVDVVTQTQVRGLGAG